MPNLKIADKPTPPAWADLTKEEQARRSLAALGIDDPSIALALDRRDAVHAALVELWRELKRQPTYQEIRERAALTNLPIYAVRDVMAQLRNAGRVVSPRPKINIPVIEG